MIRTAYAIIGSAEHLVEAAIAAGNVQMASSARLCIEDARACADDGDDAAACRNALYALRYSHGIFAPEYQALASEVAA